MKVMKTVFAKFGYEISLSCEYCENLKLDMSNKDENRKFSISLSQNQNLLAPTHIVIAKCHLQKSHPST